MIDRSDAQFWTTGYLNLSLSFLWIFFDIDVLLAAEMRKAYNESKNKDGTFTCRQLKPDGSKVLSGWTWKQNEEIKVI